MPSFHELIQQQHPEALGIAKALEALVARGKAEDRVKAASTLLDGMRAAEAHARSIRDGQIAELQRRLDALGQDDELGRAQLALERATLNAAYKPAANALGKAEDALADAERDLKAAVNEVARHPIMTPTP